MTPEEMTDEQLVESRTVTSCVEREDGGWDVTYSCGHQVIFVIQPEIGLEMPGCAQCANLVIDRRKAKR